MNLAYTEQVKYIRMWGLPDYRYRSPGETLVPVFLKHYSPPATLIDLGAGTGRASLKLKQAGFTVTMLDITARCLDSTVRGFSGIPIIEQCLWEPIKEKFDLFYCVDVMEHIPPGKVNAVLDNISEVAKAGLFQIALFEEGFGGKIGETLHLTIKPREWWIDRLNKRWKTSKFINLDNSGYVTVFVSHE